MTDTITFDMTDCSVYAYSIEAGQLTTDMVEHCELEGPDGFTYRLYYWHGYDLFRCLKLTN